MMAADQLPPFTFTAAPLTQPQRHRLYGSSWRPGCPVSLDDLRWVRLRYVDFDGTARTGTLVVNADATTAIRTAFADLYAHRFPIRRMRIVDDYGASDYRSIEADNTSSFNCRRATGATRWSQHAYGRARGARLCRATRTDRTKSTSPPTAPENDEGRPASGAPFTYVNRK
jgi:hypothetical protein